MTTCKLRVVGLEPLNPSHSINPVSQSEFEETTCKLFDVLRSFQELILELVRLGWAQNYVTAGAYLNATIRSVRFRS